MALNLEDKKALVAEVAEVAASAQSVVAAEYRGLTVSQMTELRAKARKSGVYMRVVKNTLIPLSIAFMRADGTVTDIDEMDAETTNNHCPSNNGYYALEMSKGWFSSKGIKPGMKIQGLPPVQ